MDFKEILVQLTQKAPGGKGAALVAKDGLIVEMHSTDDLQLEEIAVHITQPLMKSEETAVHTGIGKFNELLIFTENYCIIVTDITSEYFLMLVICQDSGIYGKGRYEAGKVAHSIRPELE